MANLVPRGFTGRLYVEDHQTLLHTKYIRCGPHGFREEYFKLLPFKSMEAYDQRGVANLNPRDMIGRIYVEVH